MLDKPSNSQVDDLLNIKEKTSTLLKSLLISELSKSLISKAGFLWLTVYKHNCIRIHIHQTTKKIIQLRVNTTGGKNR